MGHRRSGRRLGNQRRVSRGCIRSFDRPIRIASSDPDTIYHGVHTHVNTAVRRNPAATPKVHAKTLLPDPRSCLDLSYLRPQLSYPPTTSKGFVLVCRERVRCDVGRFPTGEIGGTVRTIFLVSDSMIIKMNAVIQ